jgi:hypothetical protein
MYLYGERPICQSINKYKYVCIKPCMEKDEVIEDDETKTTLKVPAELLDDFKHLAIDLKTTVTALIVESMKQYLKEIKKK